MIYIFIDTNIYIDNIKYWVESHNTNDSLNTNTMVIKNLSEYPFLLLKRYAEKELVQLVIPSVAKLELENKVKVICDRKGRIIDKLMHDLETLTGSDSDACLGLSEFQKSYSMEEEIKSISERLEQFWDSMKCVHVKSEKVDVDSLVKAHYERKPPFTSKKSREYQDCFSMIALQEFTESARFNNNYDELVILTNDEAFSEYAAEKNFKALKEKELFKLLSYSEMLNTIIKELNDDPDLFNLPEIIQDYLGNHYYNITYDHDKVTYDNVEPEVIDFTVTSLDNFSDKKTSLIWFSCTVEITFSGVLIPLYDYDLNGNEITNVQRVYMKATKKFSLTGCEEVPYICTEEGELNREADFNEGTICKISCDDNSSVFEVDITDADISLI